MNGTFLTLPTQTSTQGNFLDKALHVNSSQIVSSDTETGWVRGQRACQGVSFRFQLPRSSKLCPDYDRLIKARAAGISNGIQNACLLHRTFSRSSTRETLVMDSTSSIRGTVRTRNQSFLVRNVFVTAEQYIINSKIHDGYTAIGAISYQSALELKPFACNVLSYRSVTIRLNVSVKQR